MGCTPLLAPGHSRVLCAGPHVGRAVRSVRGRRGCAAMRSLRRRLPLALPLSRRGQARVSAMAGEAGWGGGPRGYGKDLSTPPGQARAARSLFSVRRAVLRCRSCSGDPAPTPAPAPAPAPGEGAHSPSSARQAPGSAKVSVAVGKGVHVGKGEVGKPISRVGSLASFAGSHYIPNRVVLIYMQGFCLNRLFFLVNLFKKETRLNDSDRKLDARLCPELL